MDIDVTKYRVGIAVLHHENDFSSAVEMVDLSKVSGKELEPIVDADINEFAEFYVRALNNGNLSGFERAVIKTYLAWKLNIQGK